MSGDNPVMSYEDYLEKYGVLTYRFRGVSMLPMLRQNTDLISVCRKTPERCKKYDVVLYRRKPDQYVLHRVVKVREKDYVILGDNCVNKEYGITDDDIIGILTEYIRDGKKYSVNSLRNKLYSRVRVFLYPLRKRYCMLRSRLSHIEFLRRLLGK